VTVSPKTGEFEALVGFFEKILKVNQRTSMFGLCLPFEVPD